MVLAFKGWLEALKFLWKPQRNLLYLRTGSIEQTDLTQARTEQITP